MRISAVFKCVLNKSRRVCVSKSEVHKCFIKLQFLSGIFQVERCVFLSGVLLCVFISCVAYISAASPSYSKTKNASLHSKQGWKFSNTISTPSNHAFAPSNSRRYNTKCLYDLTISRLFNYKRVIKSESFLLRDLLCVDLLCASLFGLIDDSLLNTWRWLADSLPRIFVLICDWITG